MIINDETAAAVAKAIRNAIAQSWDDYDLAEAALEAFAEHCSLDDFDSLQADVMRDR